MRAPALPDEWTETALRFASDDYVKQPLWQFPPRVRPMILAERRKRFGAPDDEIGDPDYA